MGGAWTGISNSV